MRKRNLRILTWNVFWEAMTEGKLAECPADSRGTICLQRVAQFVDKVGPFDLVCFQETANYQKIIRQSNELQKMIGIQYKPGFDRLISWYNESNLIPDSYPNKLELHMSSVNRPCFALFFNEQIVLINLHAGHKSDAYYLSRYLNREINSLNPANREIILEKMWKYDIIIAGDFNANVIESMNHIEIGGRKRKLFGSKTYPSCCDKTMRAKRLTLYFDHVLSTIPNTKSKVIKIDYASDHMPVIAQINLVKIIAYDFDGVFHKSVKPINNLGQRQHYSNTNLEPFEYMIRKIKSDLLLGNHVIIITARSYKFKKQIDSFVQQYLGKVKLDVVCTNGRSKVDDLFKLGVNVFYDDSPYNILDAYRASLVQILPVLTDIYYVIPEKNRCIWVDDKVIRTFDQYIGKPVSILNTMLKSKTRINEISKQILYVINNNKAYLLDSQIRYLVDLLNDKLEMHAEPREIEKIQRMIAERLIILSTRNI